MSHLQNTLARALTAFQTGQQNEAEQGFKKVLRSEPKHFGALNLYAALLILQERFAEAEPLLRKAIALNAQSEKTFYNYGLALKALGKPLEALGAFRKSIELNPVVAETWNNLGAVYNDLGQSREAITSFDKAIALQPGYAEAFSNKGWALRSLGETEAALAAFRRATSIMPSLWEAWLEIGNLCCNRFEFQEAIAAYDNVVRLKPDNHQARLNLSLILSAMDRDPAPLDKDQKAPASETDLAKTKAVFLQLKAHHCDWDGYAELARDFIGDDRNFELGISPFNYLSLPISPAQQFASATNFAKFALWNDVQTLPRNPRPENQKIRIAYLSADFHEHPVSYLLVGTLEHHDRERFEVIGISLRPVPDSPLRQRIKAAFDEFHDVSAMSDSDAAMLIRDMNVDLMIDLGGYTQGQRTPIFARRPARVQINYLGFPSTMGVPFMDYIIGDKTVIPDAHQDFYTEKIAWLPDCYLPADNKRSIAALTKTRSDFGLPPEGFVFCCFNNTFKITPEIFDVWLRLLKQIDGSVLWMFANNSSARVNLRKQAEAAGVAASRLIFAERTASNDDHLARYRLADLFLDTPYYNAHTTASDALWVGLPVLASEGQVFAGRVASSLLKAIGLPELATTSLEDYEALALKLAREPALLASIKNKLAANRLSAPLFDTARYTRHLEAAYTTMHERALRGEPPVSFAVDAMLPQS